MKKLAGKEFIYLFLSLSVSAMIFVSAKLLLDNTKPEITIKDENFKVSCMTTYDDLLGNAVASDDNLKDFFIEESDLNNIVSSKVLRYVAIDESGNVSKKTLLLNVSPDIATYNIFLKKDLSVQLGEEIDFNHYFELRNGCGWKKEGKFVVRGFDLKNIGVYEVVVSSIGSKDFVSEMTVLDFRIPVINLKYDEITLYTDESYDFINNIEEIKDDVDSKDYLMDHLEIEKDDLSIIGEHEVIYSVIDSEGYKGTSTMTVIVKERPVENYTYQNDEPEYIEDNSAVENNSGSSGSYQEPSYSDSDSNSSNNESFEQDNTDQDNYGQGETDQENSEQNNPEQNGSSQDESEQDYGEE